MRERVLKLLSRFTWWFGILQYKELLNRSSAIEFRGDDGTGRVGIKVRAAAESSTIGYENGMIWKVRTRPQSAICELSTSATVTVLALYAIHEVGLQLSLNIALPLACSRRRRPTWINFDIFLLDGVVIAKYMHTVSQKVHHFISAITLSNQAVF